MPELAVRAGACVRLTVTGRADCDLHRWNVSVLPAAINTRPSWRRVAVC